MKPPLPFLLSALRARADCCVDKSCCGSIIKACEAWALCAAELCNGNRSRSTSRAQPWYTWSALLRSWTAAQLPRAVDATANSARSCQAGRHGHYPSRHKLSGHNCSFSRSAHGSGTQIRRTRIAHLRHEPASSRHCWLSAAPLSHCPTARREPHAKLRTRVARPGQAAAGADPPTSRSDREQGVATVRADWRRNGGRRGGGGAGRRCLCTAHPGGRVSACTRGTGWASSPTWPGIFGPAPELKVAGGRGRPARRVIERRSRAIRGDPQGSQAQTVISRPNSRSNLVPGRSRAPQATRTAPPQAIPGDPHQSRAIQSPNGYLAAPNGPRTGPGRSKAVRSRSSPPRRPCRGDPG